MPASRRRSSLAGTGGPTRAPLVAAGGPALGLLAAALLLAATAAPPAAVAQATCRECHADPAMFEDEEGGERLLVTDEHLAASIHGEMGMACVDCHADMAEDEMHGEEVAPVDCSTCHPDAVSGIDDSVHGYARERFPEAAPTCASCHGDPHAVLPSSDPASPVHPQRVAETCGDCHGAGLISADLVRLPATASSYARSVHAQAVERGEEAATCVDCHGAHEVRSAEDPRSPMHLWAQTETCGECHAEVAAEFEASIHGRALAAGLGDSPTCSDCHGEHLILGHDDPDAATHAGRLALETCARCHDDPTIIAKYRLQEGVVGSYVDSYHGWATRRSYEAAATCIDCHTAHSVLPAGDPDSTIHPANVVATCAECHPRASPAFAASYTHVAASVEMNPVNRVVRSIYQALILLVIGGMLLHNGVIFNYYLVERRRHHHRVGTVVRMTRVQVVQHAVLAVSFILLVVTGFALRFPEAWWVRYLGLLGMTEPVRANLHRVCGVVLIGLTLFHLGFLLLARRGRYELAAVIPRVSDLRELVDNLRFHLWRRSERARFARYDYAQKAEYWAVVWGTGLMIATGLVLWFPALTTRILPSWIVPVSQTVHYYEAWLATLAIVVWHFFFVIFHPEVYPMSWTWLTGKMSVDHAREHHPEWFDEEVAPETARRERYAGRTGADSAGEDPATGGPGTGDPGTGDPETEE